MEYPHTGCHRDPGPLAYASEPVSSLNMQTSSSNGDTSVTNVNTDSTDSFNVNPILTVYSNSLLIMPPVPDLSMPFNVMSITCTFFALIIGSTINITIRKSREKMRDKFNGIETPTLKQKLKAKIVNLKEKLFKRKKDSLPPSSSKDKVE